MSLSEEIQRARAISDIFEELQIPSHLSCLKLGELQLSAFTGSTLPPEYHGWMLNCIKTDLQGLYEASLMKWNQAEKEQELRHEHQRFIVAHHGKPLERVGFLSYRWDMEEERAIMYVYEVNVVLHMRGKGIGFALMDFAELLCRRAQVPHILLTVFEENQAAMRLYRNKLSYFIDESSPSQYGYENVGYEILSKKVF